MLALGIDPGTATTGYGLVKETASGDLQMIEFGIIRTKPTQKPEERLLELYKRIKEIILLHRPECSAVEKLFFQNNVTSAIAVGQARGVILLALAESALPVGEYTPLEVKKAVTGYGGAEKRQVQEMVKAILGLKEIPKPDDAADALAIAICHLHSYRLSNLAAISENQ
jgi:crossover junction endodeoxyribonuclease RuvC